MKLRLFTVEKKKKRNKKKERKKKRKLHFSAENGR